MWSINESNKHQGIDGSSSSFILPTTTTTTTMMNKPGWFQRTKEIHIKSEQTNRRDSRVLRSHHSTALNMHIYLDKFGWRRNCVVVVLVSAPKYFLSKHFHTVIIFDHIWDLYQSIANKSIAIDTFITLHSIVLFTFEIPF